MQLVVDIADMGADGADADAVFVRNLFIAKPIHKRVEDLIFPDGKLVIFPGGGGACLEGLDDPAGDAGGHGGAAMIEVPDGLDNLPGGCFFEGNLPLPFVRPRCRKYWVTLCPSIQCQEACCRFPPLRSKGYPARRRSAYLPFC